MRVFVVLMGVIVAAGLWTVAESLERPPAAARAATEANPAPAPVETVPVAKLKRAVRLYHAADARADRLSRVLRHREQYRATLVLAGVTYPRANIGLADRIMRCEAGAGGASADTRGEPSADAANPRSTAGGRAQYLEGTWRSTPEGRAGLSRFDPVAGVFAIVRHLANSGNDPSPWLASRACWG